MDDLSQKIESFLNSPGNMEKIQAAMNSLSASLPTGSAPPPSAEAPDISGLLEGLGGGGNNAVASSLPDLSRVLPLLSGLSKEDENTALLKALRPLLHGDRERRIDDAIQMMKLMKLIPLLQKGSQ